jgi:LysM domain
MGHNSPLFETLKQKYQSVFNLMQQLQVQVLSVNMEGNRLSICGVAPSVTVKNRVWDLIRLIDPGYADLICDLTIVAQHRQQGTALGEAAVAASPSLSGGPDRRRYTVKPGDTLTKLSHQFYGDAHQSMKILDANRDVLSGANTIRPGQELVIPE